MIYRRPILLALLASCALASVPAQSSDPILRKALVAGLTRNPEALRETFQQAQAREAARGDTRPIRSSEAIAYLYNCTLTDREAFLAGQEVLAAQARSTEWKNQVLLSLLTDEVYELNRLEGQNRFNKFTRVFNRVSSSLSQLAMLQPQAAASLLWDGIHSIRQAKPATVKERKMLYLCHQFLKKYGNAPERAEVEALRAQMQNKLLTDRAKTEYTEGKLAFERGQYDLAEYKLERSALLGRNDPETSSLLTQSRQIARAMRIARADTLGVSSWESILDAASKKQLSDAVTALLARQPKTLEQIRAKSQLLWDSIDFAGAAHAEQAGRHDQAIALLTTLQQSAPQSVGGKAAAAVLGNPNYNISQDFQKALDDMAKEKRDFILTGRRTTDETVYAAGSAAIQGAGQAAAGVPILFGMDAAVRAISEQFRTQVSVDRVLDAGARYMRKYPNSPQSKQIAGQLAVLARKSGDYERSQEYLEESGGGTPEEKQKIRENLAIKLFDQAKNSTDLVDKQRILKKLNDEYADTKIVKKSVADEMQKIPPSIGGDSIVVSRKALMRDPQLLSYLGIAPALADDNRNNGEVSEEGICINPAANNIEFALRGEKQFRYVAFPQQNREWLITAAMELRTRYESIQTAQDLLYRQKAPVAIEGGVGSSGVEMAPKVLPYPTSSQDKKRFN